MDHNLVPCAVPVTTTKTSQLQAECLVVYVPIVAKPLRHVLLLVGYRMHQGANDEKFGNHICYDNGPAVRPVHTTE